MEENMTYGKAVAELESIVARMQADNCDIDNLAAYTSRAFELLKYCKEKLFTTDREVKSCLEALGN